MRSEDCGEKQGPRRGARETLDDPATGAKNCAASRCGGGTGMHWHRWSPVHGLLAASLLPLFLSACSTSKMAVGAMTPVLENSVDAALRSSDLQLVEGSLPTSILLLEGMQETDPGNEEVARLASILSFAYAFAFIEPVDTLRASAFYERGMKQGWQALNKPSLEEEIRGGTFEELREALPKLKEKDAPAMLWIAANWAGWTQLNLQDPTAAADFARLLPFAERLVELDESSYWGMPRILSGSIHAGRPAALGGEPQKAQEEFTRAFDIADRNLLLAQVFYAKTYCVQTFDRECYESSLQEVLQAPPNALPEAEFLNQIARREAARLLERAEEIFE
jgi:hypothetical protein